MKTYFNDAVIGNSRMLGCLDRKGELVRLFWPHIDYPQHIESFKLAIYHIGKTHSTKWLHSDVWKCKQKYIKDTNILETMYSSNEVGLDIFITDFTAVGEDILVRKVEIKNTGDRQQHIGCITYSNFISNTTDVRSTLFDFEADCLVHYRHHYYIAVAGSLPVSGFQIGDNPYNAAQRSEFYGIHDIGMTGEAVQSWDIGLIYPNEKKVIILYLCCAHTLKESLEKVWNIRQRDVDSIIKNVNMYWKDYLKRSKPVATGNEVLDALYRRSLLVCKLMSDEVSGGLLAAPEVDEHFTRCGRYAYCWGRDAAFITSALDKAGYTDLVDKFYRWAIDAQGNSGAWQQRYHLDGNLAPSWGLQIDETGTLLWGMLQHYRITGKKAFLSRAWDAVSAGADFLVNFISEENNLPSPTYDLWEERIGQHTYSAAAVYAGLKAAMEISVILKKDGVHCAKWDEAAERIEAAIEKYLWNAQRSTFYRGLNSTVEGWGFEGHGGKREIVINAKGYKRWVSALDIMVDISLLGVAIPFEVFDQHDEKVIMTVEAIEQNLTSPITGGIRRYETDGYIGGNPWIVSTLWLALYYIRNEQYAKAKEFLLWTAKHKTDLGLLPEQVDKYTGQPAWVIALTWSHAMFILVYFELVDKGGL